MASWQSGDIVANGIRIHYYRTRGDRPPLVLSHGFADDGLCWTRVARALEDAYDVIMPDARGHGLSDAPDGGYTPADRAADLAGLIEALGLERPAIGGHSMGATTSLYCAALRPDLVRCALLEDPGLRVAQTAADREHRAQRVARELDEYRMLSREELIDRQRERSPTWDEVEYGPWADSKKRLRREATRLPPGLDRPTWQEALAAVTCPVLLLTADPGRGAIVTREQADEIERILPDVRIVRLGGVGHDIRREAFEAYVDAVRGFLAEVGQTGGTIGR